MKLDSLPGLEALETPGKNDGEVKVVRTGDEATVYSWEAGTAEWKKVSKVL